MSGTAPTPDAGAVAVTGGAGALGLALGRAFARRGRPVALLDLDPARLEAARAALAAEGTVLALTCDVTDPEACEAAMAEADRRLGGLAVLVNNAGIGHRSAFADTDPAVFRRVMEVNFFGSLNATRAALPFLRPRRGRIGVVSSVAGFAPLVGRSGYAASKHALHGLFETARAELEPEGLSVTMICPSFLESPFEARTLGADGAPVGRPRSKVGRLARPEDVAGPMADAILARRPLLVLSPVGRASWLARRLWPRGYERLMARLLRSEIQPR